MKKATHLAKIIKPHWNLKTLYNTPPTCPIHTEAFHHILIFGSSIYISSWQVFNSLC